MPVRLGSFDGRYSWRRLEFRGQYAHGWMREAGLLNRVLQRRRGANPNIAEQIRGFYLEGAVYLLPFHSSQNLAVFTRYENFDTQYRMPAGFSPSEAVRPFQLDGGCQLLPAPGRGVQGRLRLQPQRQSGDRKPEPVQSGPRLVVLENWISEDWFIDDWSFRISSDGGNQVIPYAVPVLLLFLLGQAGPEPAEREPKRVYMRAERFSFTPSRIKLVRRGSRWS